MNVNVTKSVFVSTALECAHLCRATQTCQAFRHKNADDIVNCKITEGEPGHSITHVNDDAKGNWTLYILEPV